MERSPREMGYAVERYQRDERGVAQPNGRPYSNNEQMSFYQRQPSNNGQLYSQAPSSDGKESQHTSLKHLQNAAAILHYSKMEKGQVQQGRHAAALAQLYQNDLHNVNRVELTQNRENGDANGSNAAPLAKSQNYITQQLNLQAKFYRAQSSVQQERLSGKAQKSEHHNGDLRTSFDPMKDRHLWTMWRTAVNGRIVDEVRQLEKNKSKQGPSPSPNLNPSVPGSYGKALVAPPLKQFIRLGDGSEAAASRMSNLGQGSLETSQFVYYGLPRVYVSHIRK